MTLGKFKSDERGSMAAISAVALTTVLLVAAVAIDYTGMANTKNNLQSAADSAALAAAVSGDASVEEMKAVAIQAASANYSGEFDLNLELENSGATLKVEISTDYDMLMMGIFGNNDSTINVESGSVKGMGAKLNLALALDTTLSMEGARMSNMISAAADLVDRVEEADRSLGNAKIAVIPFADYVRIDRSYRDKPWIDVQADHEVTWETLDEENSTNCREEGSGESAKIVCDSYVYETQSSTASRSAAHDGW